MADPHNFRLFILLRGFIDHNCVCYGFYFAYSKIPRQEAAKQHKDTDSFLLSVLSSHLN
jgi:hypothetical protein